MLWPSNTTDNADNQYETLPLPRARSWGSIVNRTRDLARLASATVDDEAACGRIINFTAAFAIGAKQQLRGEKTPSEYFGLIEEPELEDMMTAAHVPLVILDKISWTVRGSACIATCALRSREDAPRFVI